MGSVIVVPGGGSTMARLLQNRKIRKVRPWRVAVVRLAAGIGHLDSMLLKERFPVDVIVIEDDHVLGRALQRGLEENQHQCSWVRNGVEGLDLASGRKGDAVILDLNLPDMPGLDVLRSLRQRGVQTPVLILSALGSVEERIQGLEAGADDYVVKPFAFSELLARLTAVTRWSIGRVSHKLTVGPLSLDMSLRRATRGDQEIELTPTEFSLLEFLMRNVGHVVTRKMLCEHLWESDWEGVTNVIEVHVTRLRGKMDRDFDEPLLQTVRGRGYMLRTPNG
jgi:two-component system OmpR family response regulator/two-component system copper resistance phosphate regulon response regulator CusR